MEKKISVISILYILSGILVIVCMFANWFPVELDLGVIQINELFGKLNAFTISEVVADLESELGVLVAFLPEEFETLKTWSIIMRTGATVTVILYVCAMVMYGFQKKRFREIFAVAAATAATATAIIFCKVITEVYSVSGVNSATNVVLSVLRKSPWIYVAGGAVLSTACALLSEEALKVVGLCIMEWITEIPDRIAGCAAYVIEWITEIPDRIAGCAAYVIEWITEIPDRIAGWMAHVVECLKNVINYLLDWAQVIGNNLGFLFSDLTGAVVGIWTISTLGALSELMLLNVVVGLCVAGATAGALCWMVLRILSYRNKQKTEQ